MAEAQNVRPRRAWQWGDVRKRHLGMWAYILNRLSGLGLTLYLFLHLAVLSTLARGPQAWDRFLVTVTSPFFLAMDVVVLAGLVIHGLNGLRVALTGFGIGVPAHKRLFVGLMALGLLIGLWGAWTIFTK